MQRGGEVSVIMHLLKEGTLHYCTAEISAKENDEKDTRVEKYSVRSEIKGTELAFLRDTWVKR